MNDLRYAARGLRRSPGFAAAAVVTLALGIGANTAIFSAIDEILFRPPEVPAPERLVQVYSFNRGTSTHLSSSYPDYLDFRQQARSFENLAAYARFPLNVRLGSNAPERISVEAVSGNYFAMLKTAPLLGRALGPSDDEAGAAPVAMIAEDLWRTRLHADSSVVGRTVQISGQSFTIAGVVPRKVGGLNLNWVTPPRLWIPLHASALVIPRFDAVLASRGAIWLVLAGRLREGAALDGARAELQTVAANIAGKRNLTAVAYPLSRSKFWPSYRNDIQTSLTGFGLASGLILLLACANVSNLLLGRAVGRRREMALRLALGADRVRIARQMLTESAVLAALSLGAAMGVAVAFMQLLRQFPNALGLPLYLDLQLEPRAVTFSFVLTAGAIVLFGLAPALQSARLDLSTAPRHGWFRGVLVAMQAALAMVLLTGGGLYGRALWKAYGTDLGFRGDHLLTAAFSLPPPGSEEAVRMWEAQKTLLARLPEVPGVVSATFSSTGILSAVRPKARVTPAEVDAVFEYTGPDYFKTMGIPLLEGQDTAGKEGMAVVNATLARKLGGSPVGRTISVAVPRKQEERFVVVGVAGDTRSRSVWEPPEPQVYLPAGQGNVSAGFLAVRTMAPPMEVAETLRRTWNGLSPAAPLYEIQSAAERVDESLTPQRVAAGILGGFAALALCLTAIGLYSVVAFSVAQQKREIGIRMAIGAEPGAVFAAVLRRSLIPAAGGLVLGAGASIPLMKILAVKARDVSHNDGLTYGVVSLILLAVAMAAAFVPARRAMQVDPAAALRE